MTPGRRHGHIQGKMATLVKSSVFLKNWYCPEEGTRGKSGRFDAWNLPGKRGGTDVRRLLSALPGPRARPRSGFALGDFAVSVVKGNEPFSPTALSAPLSRCIEKVRFILRFIYLFERKRVSQRAQAWGGGEQVPAEQGARPRGLDPRTLGSPPEPKADAQPTEPPRGPQERPSFRGRSPPAVLFTVVVSAAPAGSSRATGSRQTPAISRLPFRHPQFAPPPDWGAGSASDGPIVVATLGACEGRTEAPQSNRVTSQTRPRVPPDSESVGFPRGSYASIKRIINRFLSLF